MTNFRMEFETSLSEDECKKLIKKQNDKDVREASMIVKIMEGKSGELGFMRRKVAGKILENMQRLALNENQRQWILSNLKERAEKGAESFISYDNGKLVVEFDEFGKMGSDYMKRTKAAEKKLQKRFKASSYRYLDEKEWSQ
jgi:hypothetical protein